MPHSPTPFLLSTTAVCCLIAGCATGARTAARQTISQESTRSSLLVDSAGIADDDRDRDRDRAGASDVRPASHSSAGETGATADNEVQVTAAEFTEQSVIPSEAVEYTPESLEQLALQNNPSVRRAVQQIDRLDAVARQVSLRPNPTVAWFADEIGNDSSAGMYGLQWTQVWVRGAKLEWNRDIGLKAVATGRLFAEAQRRRVMTDIRVAWCELLAASQRLRLLREFELTAQRAVKVSQERLDARIGSRPDLLQSEIQLQQVLMDIRIAETQQESAWHRIWAVIGSEAPSVPQIEARFPAVPDDRTEETEFARICAASPQLAAAEMQVARARSELHRQQVQATRNVTGQFTVGVDDASNNHFTGIQLSVPVRKYNCNVGNIRAAGAALREATAEAERIRMGVRSELAQVMQQRTASLAQVRMYEELILPKAEETLQLIDQALEAGQFDFLRVLTARRARFDAELALISARRDLGIAEARLEGLLLDDSLAPATAVELTDDLRGAAFSGQ